MAKVTLPDRALLPKYRDDVLSCKWCKYIFSVKNGYFKILFFKYLQSFFKKNIGDNMQIMSLFLKTNPATFVS